MPHLPKYPKQEQRVETEYWVTCWKCGYKWRPDPRKWSNWHLADNEVKLLPCPNCGSKNRLFGNDIKKLLEQRGLLDGHNQL